MRYLKTLFLFALIGGQLQPAVAQQAQSCTEDSLYHLLDFWVGDWEVFDQDDKLVGHNRIEAMLDHCAIMEHWTGASGGEGKSLFYVDKDGRKWKQVWVTGSAKAPCGQKEKEMVYHKSGEQAVFQGTYLVNGKPVLDRTILTRMSADEVRQEIEISYEGGQNWKDTFIGIYKKK